MVLPINEKQNQALAQLVAPYNQYAYIGATDELLEGHFVDAEGKTLVFEKWGRGQPDNFKDMQDCTIVDQSGYWDDNNCSVVRLIVCEI